ncbi:hypothetical protein COC69_01075 [Bacillus cereus]|uniref:Uncharacterized protein n=1 Tax=Bacillus cereus TaxID=1396 RepID=A0A9X7GY57_BACCE|nr:hypothetical protein [Bacillus cereus]PGS83982.1 hypothetical protein COC69_01075 [Bacillus cereus]
MTENMLVGVIEMLDMVNKHTGDYGEYESREEYLSSAIRVAVENLNVYKKYTRAIDETLIFTVTKLIFACGTIRYSLQAYSRFGDELDFGMFDTKEEAYERKDYYTKNDVDYDELELAETYGPGEGE